MNTVSSKRARVYRFLRRNLSKRGWDFSEIPDKRQQKKVKHSLNSIVWAILWGLIGNRRTLRDVEEMTQSLGPWASQHVPEPISDTTLDTEARRLDQDALHNQLIQQIRDWHRAKMLKPCQLPTGIVTIDGKNLATVSHDAQGSAHQRSSETAKWAKAGSTDASYYLMPALRATLTSAEAKPAIFQLPLPPGTGESTSLRPFVQQLDDAYGQSHLFDILDMDAGLTSLENANAIHSYGYQYIFGLKENQPLLLQQAQSVLLPRTYQTAPNAQTDWECRNGKKIRRQLWRTSHVNGFETSAGRWTHLTQIWLVVQETQHPNGTIDIEDRYFLTSIPWHRFTPSQILLAVRNHWAVENDTFNSLDLQWREDHGPWCTRGKAVWSLGVLRLMAYNVVQFLRKRHLKQRNAKGQWLKHLRWRSMFEILRDVIKGFTCIDEAIAPNV